MRGTPDLLAALRAAEAELHHHPESTHERSMLERLVHPDFWEIGRSGLPYGRSTMLAVLSRPRAADTTLEAFEHAVRPLGPGHALLTYRTRQRRPDGSFAHAARRASVWVQSTQGWQLLYHQGTPDPDAGDTGTP